MTMTGTINPDGTAGPVGGIPQKLAGAAEKGKHVFGYSLGCRQSEDMRNGKMVDLEALGTSLGVQAVEVRTLRDAYRLLTGIDLGARALATDNDLADQPQPALQLLAVASGSHAYRSAAALQNKYYALGYKDGAIGRRVALTAQMSAAREAALAGVARVKAVTGRVPSRVVTEFNHAEQMREGSDDDKIAALSAYWRASFAAELAAEISG